MTWVGFETGFRHAAFCIPRYPEESSQTPRSTWGDDANEPTTNADACFSNRGIIEVLPRTYTLEFDARALKAIMNLPDFLKRTDDGEIQLTGHRIGLYHLIQHYNEGESAEMLASRFPTLSLSHVHKVIAFYLDNQVEIDAYVADCSRALTD
jgi:uncharacterized protein (DUF433 family)